MGKLITVSTSQIRPSQDFLKEGTIAHILDCLKQGNLTELPPTPIVRYDGQQKLIAIDGHNLIAVYDYLDKPIEVYVAGSRDDGLEGDDEAVARRNHDLREKFELVATSTSGPKTFLELRQSYPAISPSTKQVVHLFQ